MASKTTNYNLDMPGYNEVADIDVINGNMDKIDVQMKKNADSAQQSKDIVSDEYSATNTYAVGDYCIHENVLYKCKTAITTGEAFDSNKWVQTTCGTEFGDLNSNLAVIGKCKNLLNPTLKTTTQNGVTCTNNGDGTYTLNGTATNLFQVIVGEVEIKGNQQYKTVGCPNNIINKEYCLIPYNVTDNTEFGKYDYGDGTINASKKDITYRLYIFVASGTTLSNLVFKPMLTTNLNATYDDFVPYTGEGETLTHDVAELKNDLGGLSFSVSGTTLSITDGINTWTLSQ